MLSNKDSKINIIKKILKDDFLPHVGTDYKNKSLYLGYMIKKLLILLVNPIVC